MNTTPLDFSAVDFRFLLLDAYKKLGLKENEVAVLLMIDHLLRKGNTMITADLLSLKMTMKTRELDSLLVDLVRRNFIGYESTSKGMVTSLAPLKKKLFEIFENDLVRDRQNLASSERAEKLSRLYAYYQQRLKRTLSPLEEDQINDWLDSSYDEDSIKNALEDSLSSGKRTTFKAIDRLLRSGRKREDIAKEGYSGINETWDKDIENTIKAVRVNWVDEEEN